ncbi:MAG: glycosyltransferase, partial [Methanomicrobia archaeon]|nr:glycosyltransferase [Methanomicrobia archaeon]
MNGSFTLNGYEGFTLLIGDILFCIIIPFFNEEDNILPLVKEVEKVIRKNNLNIDVVTVNDGSTDSTLSKL